MAAAVSACPGMWATWILAASFTILILAGFEIVPQWSKPYPESAMFQALLVLLVGIDRKSVV